MRAYPNRIESKTEGLFKIGIRLGIPIQRVLN